MRLRAEPLGPVGDRAVCATPKDRYWHDFWFSEPSVPEAAAADRFVTLFIKKV